MGERSKASADLAPGHAPARGQGLSYAPNSTLSPLAVKDPDPPRATVPAFQPVPRKYRHDGWTPERQRAFIEALADTGSVKHAAKTVNMSPEGAYYLRRQPGAEEFAAAWAAALDRGIQRLEDIALERAIQGVEVPVYSYGKLVGSRIVHNDRLLMFMLRNRAPERFGASGMRGRMNAVQIMELKREWMAEQEARQAIEAEQTAERLREEMARVRARLSDGVWVNAEEYAEFCRWRDERDQAG